MLIHRGWLSTKTISIDYHKITDVVVEEGFWYRKFTHTGNLIIDTPGMSGDDIVLKYVENPYELKKKLDLHKDKKG